MVVVVVNVTAVWIIVEEVWVITVRKAVKVDEVLVELVTMV